jgi:hypothetical protein
MIIIIQLQRAHICFFDGRVEEKKGFGTNSFVHVSITWRGASLKPQAIPALTTFSLLRELSWAAAFPDADLQIWTELRIR